MGATSMTDSYGMPTDDGSGPAASNVDMPDPDQTQTPGFLSSLESFGSKTLAAVESGASSAYSGVKTVAGDVASGAESVASKTVGVATGAVSSITMDIVLILAVVGVALVFIARSGAISVSR